MVGDGERVIDRGLLGQFQHLGGFAEFVFQPGEHLGQHGDSFADPLVDLGPGALLAFRREGSSLDSLASAPKRVVLRLADRRAVLCHLVEGEEAGPDHGVRVATVMMGARVSTGSQPVIHTS